MEVIGVEKKPKILYIKSGSLAESEIKFFLKKFPKNDVKTEKYGNYYSYKGTSLIYVGNGHYNVEIPLSKAASISVDVKSKNILTQ
mgnify:CR=1 FL=1